MKSCNLVYRSLSAIALIVFLAGCGTTSPSASKAALIVSVDFGKTPPGGGPCSSKGICSSVASAGTNVSFAISPSDNEVLLLSFSMAELTQKQQDQAQNFVDGGTYQFEDTYNLSADTVFDALQLPPNSRIENQTKSKVKIKGDVVVVAYNFAHD